MIQPAGRQKKEKNECHSQGGGALLFLRCYSRYWMAVVPPLEGSGTMGKVKGQTCFLAAGWRFFIVGEEEV